MVEAQLGWFVAAGAAIALGWTIWAYRRRYAVIAAAADHRLRESQASAAAAANVAAAEIKRLEHALDAAQRRGAELEAERRGLADALDRLVVPVWRRAADLSMSYCNPAFAAAVDTSVDRAIADRLAVKRQRRKGPSGHSALQCASGNAASNPLKVGGDGLPGQRA